MRSAWGQLCPNDLLSCQTAHLIAIESHSQACMHFKAALWARKKFCKLVADWPFKTTNANLLRYATVIQKKKNLSASKKQTILTKWIWGINYTVMRWLLGRQGLLAFPHFTTSCQSLNLTIWQHNSKTNVAVLQFYSTTPGSCSPVFLSTSRRNLLRPPDGRLT